MTTKPHLQNVLTSAPGKIILHGEHAVVHGTIAIASSLNLRSFMQIDYTPEVVNLSFPNLDLTGSWKLVDLERTLSDIVQFSDDSYGYLDAEGVEKLKSFAGLADDVTTRNLAVIAFLHLYICISKSKSQTSEFLGLTARATSNLPTGAGLGSSAAFSASLAAGLLLFSGTLDLPTEAKPWSKCDLDLVNRWAYEGERVIHGNPSGIDNAVSVSGGALTYKGKDFETLVNMPPLRILLVNTRVPRSTKVLVAGVKAKLEKYPGVIRPVFESIEAISSRSQSELAALWEMERGDGAGDSQGVEKLYETLEDLVDMNQSFLKILGVSHPAIELICTLMSDFAIHSKLTGAGGGGCVFAVIRPSFPAEKIEEAMQKLREHDYTCWITSVGGPGVVYHPDLEDVHRQGFVLPDNFKA